MRVILLAAVMCDSLSSADLTGTVFGTEGKALPDAILTELYRHNATKTGPLGAFNLPAPSGPVLVEHKKYAPLLLFPEQFARGEVALRMIPRSISAWKVPPCNRTHITSTSMASLRLKSRHGLASVTSRDVDYELITYSHIRTGSFLRFWKRVVSTGLPGSSFIEELGAVDVRAADAGGTEGYDFRGVTTKGSFSRKVTIGFSAVDYTNVPNEAAQVFDRIIASMCYE